MIVPELPKRAISQIHKITGISRPTIHKFLSGKEVQPQKEEQIYVCALDIIRKEKLRAQRIKKERKKILSIK